MRGVILAFAVLVAGALYSVFFNSDDSQLSHQIGEVVSVNNERVTIVGTARLGAQKLTVELGDDQLVKMENLLTGALEYDEFYQVGDSVVIAEQNNRYHAVALFRLPVLIGLMTLFALGLLGYAKKVGLYSLLSFVGSVAIIFGLLIPGLLSGFSPVLITGVTVVVLSSMIILSVAGWTYKGKAALSEPLSD